MGLISMDFQSVIIGYAAGVALMWSLNEVLYGDNNEQRTETDCKDIDDGLYSRLDSMYNSTPE